MAVWMQVFGKNGLGNYDLAKSQFYLDTLNCLTFDVSKILVSIQESGYGQSAAREYYEGNRESILKWYKDMSLEDYEKHLQSLGKPFMTPEVLIDFWIKFGEQREADLKNQFEVAYEKAIQGVKSLWVQKKIDSSSVLFVNSVHLSSDYYGLTISLFNDLVCMSGPMELFSKMSHFDQMSRESSSYYHSFFKTVLFAFKSNYLLYAHEWSGLYYDDESDLTSDVLLKRVNKSTHVPPGNMHELASWFIERW